MYRNKMLAIFTVMIVILLGFIIWSSNIVADHNATQKNQSNEEQGNVIGVEIPEEQMKDFITEEPENREIVEGGDSGAIVGENNGQKIVINTNGLIPEIIPRASSTKSLNPNYIDKFDFSKKLVLWNVTTFPLQVYIKDESKLPKGFADSIKVAFSNWERATDGFIKFQYTADEASANIIVSVPENPLNGCSEVNGNDYKLNISNGRLMNAELIVPQNDCNGQAVKAATLYAPIQHQIGHILGLSEHSDRAADVMYPTPSYENTNISHIDVNTLKYLYNFVPTVTNKYYTRKEAENMIALTSLRGMDKEEIEDYLLETINSQRVATAYEVAVDEAYELYKENKYDKAALKYLEASENTDVPMDKAFALRSLAIVYLKMNRNQDAIRYANNAIDIANTPYNQYLLAYINYESGNYDTALLRLEELIKEYPKLMAAYPIMAQIYRTKNDTEKLDELVKLSKEHFGSKSPVYYEEGGQAE